MNVDFTEKLIQEVRNRPILYSLNHPDYKNSTKKWQAWIGIQRELNEEVASLKAKWKNLKDTYKKYKQSKHSTSGQAAKLRNWAWADHMRFTDPSATPDETQGILILKVECDEISSRTSQETTQDSEITQDSVPEEIQNVQQIFGRRNTNASPTKMVQYIQNRKRHRDINDRKVDVKCDGVDLLFLGYADTFKKLSKRKQVNVKFDIARILMEAELSDLDAAASESYCATPGSSYSLLSEASVQHSMFSEGTVSKTADDYIIPHGSND